MSLLNKASLIQIPSGYKDGTLYSAKPTNGDGDFTFSRGSNLAATRVNSEGLIEKGRENLLLQSNTFDTTWSTTNTTLTSGQSGYDGSTDAWKVEATNGVHRVEQNVNFSGVNTISVYAKKGNATLLRIQTQTGGTDVFFDLNDGTIDFQEAAAVDAQIEAVGTTGWYRCSMTINESGNNIRFLAQRSRFNVSNGDYIYIQDAQLEVGLVSTDVITTTTTTAQAGILEDMPRLDYSGGASCPSLLLEPQRSNVVTSSEHIGSYSVSNVSVSYNNATSPEGVQNATLVTGDSGTSTKVVNFNSASSGAYTISVFAKYDSHQWIQLGMGGIATYANFDIQNGVVGSTNGTSDIEDYGNGWYRCSVQMTTGTPISHYIGMVDSGSAVRLATSSSTNSFWAYGMQSEIGSYPTSYIPTYGGSSVTRSQDIVDGAVDSNLFNDDEGVLFVEFAALADTRDNEFRFLISDGTNNERVQIGLHYLNTLYCSVIVSNSAVADFTTSLASPSSTHKVAIRYKTNDFAAYLDGVQIGTDTSGGAPSGLDRLDFYRTPNNNNYVEANVKQTIYFNTALTNDELASLTTL